MSGAVLLMATTGGFSVSVSPAIIYGFGSGTVTTLQPLAGKISGGASPISYFWTTDNDDIFPLAPSALSTSFRINGVVSGQLYTALATLTATDAVGQVATASASISITGT